MNSVFVGMPAVGLYCLCLTRQVESVGLTFGVTGSRFSELVLGTLGLRVTQTLLGASELREVALILSALSISLSLFPLPFDSPGSYPCNLTPQTLNPTQSLDA